MTDAHVLVLNKHYQAVQVTTLRRALCLLYVGAARALDKQYRLFDFASWAALAAEVGDETIGTANRRIVIPRIVVLQVYGHVPAGRIRFSRYNIFARDDHTCQYCGEHLPRRELNLDHIVPRSRHGKTNWENVVTSCLACNFKKGGRTPEEAGMRLVRPARQPRWSELIRGPRLRIRYREWMPFLNIVDASYWNTELDSD